jgi:methionyl-tRNA formyltransferase
MNTRILLFGDDLGVPQLLRHIPPISVAAIVAAANRPQYHKPLSETAKSIGTPFAIQPLPNSKNYSAFRQWVTDRHPDLIWVNSYSMIVRDDILAVPRLGGINIHGALLPQYRGCNPTQWAILNGETETGVTLHEMSAGIDAGKIIDQRLLPLEFEDTWQDVRERIIAATDELIIDNLPAILESRWIGVAQDPRLARYHRRRTPADGQFDWEMPVINIYNLTRALVTPLPGAFILMRTAIKLFAITSCAWLKSHT